MPCPKSHSKAELGFALYRTQALDGELTCLRLSPAQAPLSWQRRGRVGVMMFPCQWNQSMEGFQGRGKSTLFSPLTGSTRDVGRIFSQKTVSASQRSVMNLSPPGRACPDNASVRAPGAGGDATPLPHTLVLPAASASLVPTYINLISTL